MSDRAAMTNLSLDLPVARPSGWVGCLIALGVTLLIVGAGQSSAMVVADALALWMPKINPLFLHLTGPVLVGVYQLALLLLLAAWVTGSSRREALALGWPTLHPATWLAIVVGLYAIKAGVSIVALWLTMAPGAAAAGGAVSVEGLGPFAAIMRSPGWPLLLAGGVLAAIVEELLYRGFLSQTLERSRLGFWGGAAIASLVWAGLHLYYPLAMQAVLFVVGMGLSWVRARTASVYPGMAWHILNNTVGLIAMRFLA